MLNTIEAYEEQGRMVAKARNNRDEGSAQAAVWHYRQMKALEKLEDEPAIKEAFERGYTAARNVQNATYYR